MGYHPILSEHNDVFFDPNLHTHASCVEAVASCDMMILIIGGRFGGTAVPDAYETLDRDELSKILDSGFEERFDKKNFSITQLEVLKAIEAGIPIWTFITRDVYADHSVYERNKDKDIDYPSITKKGTAKYIFEFFNLVRKRRVGNCIFPFDLAREIEEILTKQFAGLAEKGLKKNSLLKKLRKKRRTL